MSGWPTPASLVAAVATVSCGAGWHRVEHPTPADLSPRQQMEVWSGGSVRQWHAVRLSRDSVSGISYFQSVECDTCRRALARASVDSMRLGNPTAGFWKTFALVWLAAGVISTLYYYGYADN
jgi:hypothetical protein